MGKVTDIVYGSFYVGVCFFRACDMKQFEATVNVIAWLAVARWKQMVSDAIWVCARHVRKTGISHKHQTLRTTITYQVRRVI